MNKKGFTLIEVIGVVTVLALILIVAVPSLTRTLKRNEQNRYNDYIDNLKVAAENYMVSKLKEGESIDSIRLGELIDEGYVNDVITNPENDIQLSRSTKITVLDELDSANKYEVQVQYNIPSEYQEVEYIQNTGKNYIDTGYNPGSNTDVFLDFEFTGGTYDNSWSPILGQRVIWASAFAFWVNSGSKQLAINYNGNDTKESLNAYADGRDIYEKKDNIFYLDSKQVYVGLTNTFQANNSMLLFGAYDAGGALDIRNAHGKFYLLEIYEKGKLVRHYLPCYRKSDGVIGICDAINGTFHESKINDKNTASSDTVMTKGEDV